jgi:kynurenine formamidase
VDAHAFDLMFAEVSNTGRWGVADQRGTLNHLTADAVSTAAGLVSLGRTVSLSQGLDTVAGPDNSRPALHHMTRQCDGGSSEPQVNTDFIGIDFHGKSVTHIDALCHCSFRGYLYTGVASRDTVDSTGGSFGSVEQMAEGVAGRGILVDLPRARGVEWLEPGTAVERDELLSTMTAQEITSARGDIVLVRTGHQRRRTALGPWDPGTLSAGLHPSSMALLHECGAAVLGSDGDNDARPSPVAGVDSPIHALALAGMGMPLIDNMNLEEIADACIAANRWEFLVVLAPLRIPGGTGSPVNPIAIL